MTKVVDNISQEINDYINRHFVCSSFKGFVKIETPFLYADGDCIVVCVKKTVDDYLITDLGETLRWFTSRGISSYLSEKEDGVLNNIMQYYGIQRHGDMFLIRIKTDQEVGEHVFDFCQAISRISDISFMV